MRFKDFSYNTFLEQKFRYVNSKEDAYFLYKNRMGIELMITSAYNSVKMQFKYEDKFNGMVYTTVKTEYTGINQFAIEYYKIRHMMDFIVKNTYSNFGGSAFDYIDEIRLNGKIDNDQTRMEKILIKEMKKWKKEFDD